MFIAHDLSIVRYISDRIGVIYKGKIVEIASSEELFDYPLHPYTRSLISAIPMPDPQLEKHKVLYTYDPSMHNYTDETQPELVDIGHGHFVYGSPEEIAEYRALRERGEPLKSLSIVGVNAEAPEEGSEVNLAASEVILDRQRVVRDTFLLPADTRAYRGLRLPEAQLHTQLQGLPQGRHSLRGHTWRVRCPAAALHRHRHLVADEKKAPIQ